MQDGSREQDDEYGERGVLKVSQLHFHRPELHPPSDGGVDGWRLEADCLPVGWLDVLNSKIVILQCDSSKESTITRLEVIHTSSIILVNKFWK